MGTVAMPVKSSVKRLPPDLQWELDRKIIEGDFQSTPDLSRWLELRGYAVPKTTLHRHKRQLEKAARVDKVNGVIIKDIYRISTAQFEWESFHLTERMAAMAKALAAMAKRKKIVEEHLFSRYRIANQPANLDSHRPDIAQTKKPKT